MTETHDAHAQAATPTCPDGGTCHHKCKTACFRVGSCGPLSGVFPGDDWPKEVVAQHKAKRAEEVQLEADTLRTEAQEALSRLIAKHQRALSAADECRLYDDDRMAAKWDAEAKIVAECIRVVVGHSNCVRCMEPRDLEGATALFCHDCAAGR